MSTCTRFVIRVALPAVFVWSSAGGQVPAKASPKFPSACAALTATDIQKLTGRSDVATGKAEAEELDFHSNCMYSGAFDIGVTVAGTTKVMFGRMRDNYSKAPARLGYRVEPVSGVGDDAYYLLDKDRVKLTALVGEKEVTIALAKISMLPGDLPPEPTAKAFALTLAKAAVAKLRTM